MQYCRPIVRQSQKITSHRAASILSVPYGSLQLPCLERHQTVLALQRYQVDPMRSVKVEGRVGLGNNAKRLGLHYACFAGFEEQG